MAIADILRSGVKIASKVLDSVKVDVVHRAWTGQDGVGGDTYAAPATRRAIVDLTKRALRTSSGVMVMTYATLTFLDPIEDTTPTAPHVRENPIDARDLITLPDGGTAPIVQTGSVVDSATNRPYIQETILGSVERST